MSDILRKLNNHIYSNEQDKSYRSWWVASVLGGKFGLENINKRSESSLHICLKVNICCWSNCGMSLNNWGSGDVTHLEGRSATNSWREIQEVCQLHVSLLKQVWQSWCWKISHSVCVWARVVQVAKVHRSWSHSRREWGEVLNGHLVVWSQESINLCLGNLGWWLISRAHRSRATGVDVSSARWATWVVSAEIEGHFVSI